MNRQHVLRGHRDQQQHRQQGKAHAIHTGIATNPAQGMVGQRMGQARLSNRHRERPQQGIRQSHRRAIAEAFIEGRQRAVDAHAGQQTTAQRADNQSHYHVHTQQTQQQHHRNGDHHGIHVMLRFNTHNEAAHHTALASDSK